MQPDAYREGFELKLPASPFKNGEEWVSIKKFRESYDSKDFPPYPWEDSYDGWLNDALDEGSSDEEDDVRRGDLTKTTTLTQTERIAHTCTANIERIKAGPADWQKILGSGTKYVDASMPHEKGEMVYWPSHPRRDNLSFKNFQVVGYAPP